MSAPSSTVADALDAHTAAQERTQAAEEHLDDTRARVRAGDRTVTPADLREAADRAEHAVLAIDYARAEAEAADVQHRRARAHAAIAPLSDLPAHDAGIAAAEAAIADGVRSLRAALGARDELIAAASSALWAAWPHFLDELPDGGILPDGYRAAGHINKWALGPQLTIAGTGHNLSTGDHQLERRIGASVRAAIAEPIPGGGENQDQMPSGFRGETVAQSLR